MPENDGLRRFLKAGVVVAEVTRARVGGMLSELIKTGEAERYKAQDWVESLWKTNRDRPAAFIATVRGEVGKPFGRAKVTTVGGRAGEGSELSPPPPAVAAKKPTGRGIEKSTGGAAKKSPATKAPAKKTGGRRRATTRVAGT